MNGGNDKKSFFCKMILSKSQIETKSCSLPGFVEKKLFRIKVRHSPKIPSSGMGLKECRYILKNIIVDLENSSHDSGYSKKEQINSKNRNNVFLKSNFDKC